MLWYDCLYNNYAVERGAMADDSTLRKAILSGKKSERIIFAVTPEMKRAIGVIAEERCQSVSAYITDILAKDILANEDVVGR